MFPSDSVAERVKELRKRRGLTAQRLAELCAEAGAPELTAASLANIETGRKKDGRRTRMITVDEALALAYVLDAPISLFFLPPRGQELEVTPKARMHPADVAAWFAGEVAPRPDQWDTWLSTTHEVALYADLRQAAIALLRAGDPSYANPDDLRHFATLADKAAEAGLRPFEMAPEWVQVVRPQLKHERALLSTDDMKGDDG
ncbi:helix-turn-helix transcriptional regulator [Streptomyces hydrogenans]